MNPEVLAMLAALQQQNQGYDPQTGGVQMAPAFGGQNAGMYAGQNSPAIGQSVASAPVAESSPAAGQSASLGNGGMTPVTPTGGPQGATVMGDGGNSGVATLATPAGGNQGQGNMMNGLMSPIPGVAPLPMLPMGGQG